MPTDKAPRGETGEVCEKLKLEIYVEIARREIVEQFVRGASIEELGTKWEVGQENIEKLLRISLVRGGITWL